MISEVNIDVRYAETDKMGVVYHANYVVWLDIARNKFFADAGFTTNECEEAGVIFPVRNVDVTYLSPCRFGETVTVFTKIKEYRDVLTTYSHEIRGADGSLRATAVTGVVCVRSDSFKPVKFSKYVKEAHEKYLMLSGGK